MAREAQQALAARFRALHQGPHILVIGSVWDIPSAILFERAGFQALGTSSAGVAFSEGYPDGERIPRDAMLKAVARVVKSVRIPVSADLESGFGAAPQEVADTCSQLLATGVVGVNLEDATAASVAAGGLLELSHQVAKIRAVRSAARDFGVDLFINARTDTYWLLHGWDAQTLRAETIRRGKAYLEAGADGVFVPGVLAQGDIAALVKALDAPLNVLAIPGCPPVGTLARLGVRRVSQGSGPARACLALAQDIAHALLKEGNYEAFQRSAIPYSEANAIFDQASAVLAEGWMGADTSLVSSRPSPVVRPTDAT